MAGRVVRIERISLLRPVRKDLDQLPARDQCIETKLNGLRYAVARGAASEFSRQLIEDEPAAHLDLHNLPGPMKLPGKRPARDGVPVKEAFVPHQIARVPWLAVGGKIGRRRAG